MLEQAAVECMLEGTIDKIIFHNQENGYAVCLLEIESAALLGTTGQAVPIAGIITPLSKGLQVKVYGSWSIHKKFGKQFSFQSCIVKTPTSIEGLQRFFASGVIKGIGPAFAQRLLDHFGARLIEVIDQEPEALERVPGIGSKRAKQLVESWKEHEQAMRALVFLQDHGLSAAYAMRVYKQYKQRTQQIVSNNPYALAYDVWGIGFTMADMVARSLGHELTSTERLCAALLHCLQQRVSGGNLYTDTAILLDQASQLCIDSAKMETPIDRSRFIKALQFLYESEKVVAIIPPNDPDETKWIGRTQDVMIERELAESVKRIAEHPLVAVDPDTLRSFLETQAQTLHQLQQDGIAMAIHSGLSIVTGGPGTGKTTLTRTLIRLLEQIGWRYKLAAPTGRAAKRMTESTGRQATTIHRLLEFDPQMRGFTYNEQKTLSLDIVIIDEASMIDTYLAHALVRALPRGARLVLLGDTDQLPSVGAGNVLADLLACHHIPHTRLTHIFRQAQHSLITLNAHRIITGKPPLTHSEGAITDSIFIACQSPEEGINIIEKQIIPFLQDKKVPFDDITVITPMHRGGMGTQVLNDLLQRSFNPQSQGLVVHGQRICLQDRVMQLRNNYDKGVFNGDIGIVTQMLLEQKTIMVQFADRTVLYEDSDIAELCLAYAITVHKSQGSEYDAVIIPLFTHHYTLLNRNLLYTAVTRAKKYCIIIGQHKALHIALKQQHVSIRKTFLTAWLNPQQPILVSPV